MPDYVITYQASAMPEDTHRAGRGDLSAKPEQIRVTAHSVIAAVMDAEAQFENLGLIPRVVAVEERPGPLAAKDLDDDQLTVVLSTATDEFLNALEPDDYDDTESLYKGDTGLFLSTAAEVADALRDTGLVPGLHLSLLGTPGNVIDYTMIEIRDEARGHYVSKGCEVKHLTDDREAAGWAGVLALARGFIGNAADLT